MRRALVAGLVAVLALPAAVAAARLAPGDGTLSVSNGDGRVHFLKSFSGVVLGRIAWGSLEVINPEAECGSLTVWNEDDLKELPLRGSRDGVRCVFRTVDRSTPMLFRLVREGDEIRVSGNGIWISAVGQGGVFLQGSERRVRDGTYAINGQRVSGTLPDRGRTLQLGRSPLP